MKKSKKKKAITHYSTQHIAFKVNDTAKRFILYIFIDISSFLIFTVLRVINLSSGENKLWGYRRSNLQVYTTQEAQSGRTCVIFIPR